MLTFNFSWIRFSTALCKPPSSAAGETFSAFKTPAQLSLPRVSAQRVAEMDRAQAAHAIRDFLRALGHEPEGELAATPERVADAWADDLLEGQASDAEAILREGTLELFESGPSLMVLRDVDVFTICPHHLLPAIGKGDVVFLPRRKTAGLGAITRALDVLSRRLTLQEEIGSRMVDLLGSVLGARGALVRLSLTHTCLQIRGERKASARVETWSWGGSFVEEGGDRDMALAALRS